MMKDNPYANLVEVNGLMVDKRSMPQGMHLIELAESPPTLLQARRVKQLNTLKARCNAGEKHPGRPNGSRAMRARILNNPRQMRVVG